MIEPTIVHSKKPKLIPVKVPWRVSLSTPFLRLLAAECESDHPTEVSFLAYLPIEEDLQRKSLGQEFPVSVSPVEEGLSQFNDERDQIIKLTFNRAIWARMCPSHFPDVTVIDESAYDWSAVGGSDFQPRPDPHDWGEELWKESMKRFWEEWRRTSICPNPQMYQVENSLWLQETGASELGLKHYLILGYDAYIEIISLDFRWEFEAVEK